jgi:isoquinoline 1-oxidoreductase beta subunit
MGGVGAGFALGSFTLLDGCGPKKALASGSDAFTPNGYVKIEPDGTVTVTVFKSEMGQGVRTSTAMLVAEELDADWSKVKVTQAPGATVSVRGQGTGGSSSTRSTYLLMRQVGAAAKTMLVTAAAQKWGVAPITCSTSEGKVIHAASGKSIAYTELLEDAAKLPVPDLSKVTLKRASEYKILGKPMSRIDNPDIVTGKAKYGIDAKVDGMKYAVIARPPTIGGALKSFDDADARKIEGVVDVKRAGSGVAVIANNTWAAIKGRDALKIQWDPGPNASMSTASIGAELQGMVTPNKPAVPPGAKTIEATIDFPYLAHVCMEPMNALADVRADQATVWVGTQGPDNAQDITAMALKLPKEKVVVNNMLLGGGFGRRGSNNYVGEAVGVSSAAKCPVKLLWTREDDVRNDLFRPRSHHAFFGAVDNKGRISVWQHQCVLSNGNGNMSPSNNAQTPYDIPVQNLLMGGPHIPVPTGAWRSVINGQMVGANECFVDELAHLAGKDGYQFRKEMTSDAKLKAVLDMAAEKGNWGKSLPAGSGRGMACFRGYAAWVAHVVELTVKGGEIKVDRVVIVIDVGTAINPRGIEAQMQSACSDGLATALRAEITIEKGAVVQGSWDDYPWMTQDAMPLVEVYINQSGSDPAGIGETGYPSVCPAVANAVFAATGKRVRKFPIKVTELV